MDVREKLVEIMEDLGCNDEYCKDCEFCNDIDGCVHRQKEIIADRLIANGVTVQEWISVKDRLPETDGIYIVCDCRLNGNPWIHTAGFIKASSSWCELHGVYYDDGYGRYSEQDKITHWMPMPHPPKGE